MFFKIWVTSSELKRLALKGGRCSGQDRRTSKQTNKKKTFKHHIWKLLGAEMTLWVENKNRQLLVIGLHTLTEWQSRSSLQYSKHCSMLLNGVSVGKEFQTCPNISDYKAAKSHNMRWTCYWIHWINIFPVVELNISRLTYCSKPANSTGVSLVDALDDGQEGRCLFPVEAALSAEQHSVDVQLQQDSSLWLRDVHTKHAAQSPVSPRE